MSLDNTEFWDDLSVQAYKVLLKSKPEHPMIHTNLGLAYARLGKDPKAIRSFLRAIKYGKTHAVAYYHLGCAFERIGKRKEAVRSFKKYQKILGFRKGHEPVVQDFVDKLLALEAQQF